MLHDIVLDDNIGRLTTVLITSDIQLKRFCERAAASEVLAMDTEFMREKTYKPKLCLIQLGTDDEQVAVDAFCVNDVSPLVELFENEGITKVLHACSQDMEALLDYCGKLPRPVFDTQIAASYLGERNQIGYGALVEKYCNVALQKTEALTDWSRRPLDEQQVLYALDDVRYLPRIWRAMCEGLSRAGRLDWPQPEFERACDPATYVHDPRKAYLHVKRVSSLSRRQLAVAREVAAWRETRAAEIDRPRRRVLSDELVVEIAKRFPTNLQDMRRVRGFDEISIADQRGILNACKAGMDCPAEKWPSTERHARPASDTESVCDLMYALTRMVAEQMHVSPNILASRDDLLKFMKDPSTSPLSMGWKRAALGEKLTELLEGRIGLTVKDGHMELL